MRQTIQSIKTNICTVQRFYLELFGKYNIEKSLIWMAEECGEVLGAIRKQHDKDDIIMELGDLLNWIFILCNSLNISIDDVISHSLQKEMDRQIRKYGKYNHSSPDHQAQLSCLHQYLLNINQECSHE